MKSGQQRTTRIEIPRGTRTVFFTALTVSAVLSACIPPAQSAQVPPATRAPVARTPVVTTPPRPAPPPLPAAVISAQRILDAKVDQLGQGFNGDIGIAVKDVQTGWITHYDGTTFFPQQSVSKFWVALTALAEQDKGQLNLNSPVTVRRDDLTLFHQPIRAQVLSGGFSTTLSDLMYRAITQSDNTANDFVLWKAGGPSSVRSYLNRMGISGIRFGPGERMLQSAIAGITWNPSYSIGNGFYTARNAVPAARRRSAFESYIADPMDGATPLGIVDALTRLKKGELLSPTSTQKLLGIMSNTKTGRQRLKGGLEAGWSLAHKTGTGQVLNGVQAGYNDIGILTSPSGHSYAVAVMIRRTAAPNQERMRAMQDTVRAVIDYHEHVRSFSVAVSDANPAGVRQAGSK